MEIFETIIAALFLGLLFVKKWNIAARIKRWRGIDPYLPFNPFDCLPCFTWWCSAQIAFGVYLFEFGPVADLEGIITASVSTMAAFVAAYITDKL